MTYTARQVLSALSPLLGKGLSGDKIGAALEVALPGLTIGELKAGYQLYQHEAEIAEAERAAELAYMQKVAMYMAGETDPSITIGEVLQKHADAGDVWAKAQIDAWNSPEYLAYHALARAAAIIHPDWSVVDGDALRWKDGSAEDGGDVDTLVDWFQINHPEIAKQVEDRAKAAA